MLVILVQNYYIYKSLKKMLILVMFLSVSYMFCSDDIYIRMWSFVPIASMSLFTQFCICDHCKI